MRRALSALALLAPLTHPQETQDLATQVPVTLRGAGGDLS